MIQLQCRLLYFERHHFLMAYAHLVFFMIMLHFADIPFDLISHMRLLWLIWLLGLLQSSLLLWSGERAATLKLWVHGPQARLILSTKALLFMFIHTLGWLCLISVMSWTQPWPFWAWAASCQTLWVLPSLTALLFILSSLSMVLRQQSHLLVLLVLPLTLPLILIALSFLSNPDLPHSFALSRHLAMLADLILIPTAYISIPYFLQKQT